MGPSSQQNSAYISAEEKSRDDQSIYKYLLQKRKTGSNPSSGKPQNGFPGSYFISLPAPQK